MCAGLTSKCYLGVALCSAALTGVGGCGSAGLAASAEATRPVAPVVADPPGVTTPATAPDGPRESVATAAAADDGLPSVPTTPPVGGSSDSPVSDADVIGWVTRGTSDDVILDRIQHARNAVRLTAGDELRLRDAGVTDEVIRAMKAAAWN